MPSAVAEASADAPVLPARSNAATRKRHDADLIASIDATVDRMRKITPQDPYLVTIPHDEDLDPELIYRHEFRFHAGQYLYNTPFDRREPEDVQYQTFHLYEPGAEMYVLHNTRQDERPREESARGVRAPGTGSNTPNTNVKKISLDAYKKKQAGGKTSEPDTKTAGESAKQPAVKGPIERVKETEQVLAGLSDETPTTNTPSARDLKRKHEGGSEHASKSKDPTPAAKRPRKTSPAPATSQLPKKPTQAPVHDKAPPSPPRKVATPVSRPVEVELPPKLSPVSRPAQVDLPPRISPLQVDALPSRLSPTLPENIRLSLQIRDKARKDDRAARQKSPRPEKSKATRASSPQRNDSHIGSSPHQVPRVKSPAPPASQGEEIAVERRTSKLGPRTKPSLVVKLKYKKSNRKVVKDILRLRPKLWSAMDLASKGIRIDSITNEGLPQATRIALKQAANGQTAEKPTASKPTTSKPTTDSVKASGGDHKSQAVAGRSKPDDVPKAGPRTPVAARMNSPAVSKTSTQVTPGMRKEATSVAMRREQSNDSNINTPSAHSQNTPATSQPNGTMKAPSSQPSNKTPLQQAWEKEQRDLDSLGRELKHAASNHLANASENGKRLAAIKSVESLLSYVFAFTCAEEAARTCDPPGAPPLKLWRSLPPFVGFVRKHCENYPALQGVASLVAVSINARLIEITVAKKGEVLPVEKVLETSGAMHRAAKEADEALELDKLIQVFPETWEARTMGTGIITSKLPTPKKLGGPYKLPVGIQTPPLLAGRACYAMLEEFVRKQTGLDYRLSLKIQG